MIGTYQHLGHVVWIQWESYYQAVGDCDEIPFSLESAQRLKVEAEKKQQIPVHIPKIYDRYADLYRTFRFHKTNYFLIATICLIFTIRQMGFLSNLSF